MSEMVETHRSDGDEESRIEVGPEADTTGEEIGLEDGVYLEAFDGSHFDGKVVSACVLLRRGDIRRLISALEGYL